MFILKTIGKFVVTLIGIFLVGSLPSLFKGFNLDLPQYFKELMSVFGSLLHPSHITFKQLSGHYPVFPELFSHYWISMRAFFASFFLALILSIGFVYGTFFLPRWLQKMIRGLAFVGESIPDLFVILLFQLIFIIIYQKTHHLVVKVTGLSGSDIFLLPVLCLCILPTCMFYRMILFNTEEELMENYVELARSKGISRSALLFNHIFRNQLVSLLGYSKTIFWMLLSNLLIFEFIFHMTGITLFMYEHGTPAIITVSMIMITIPVFLLFLLGQLVIYWTTRQRVTI